jgi:predicted AlkP superfamily pyrophosphatase or phosphodiesterase
MSMNLQTSRAIILLGLIAFWIPRSGAAANLPARDRIVIVISLDGFPAYDLEDPKLPAPTLRRLAKEGAWARRMNPINPTVTWPNHTTMVTGLLPGDHGLFYNGTLVRTGGWPPVKVDPNIDKDRMVHAVTAYDLAHQAGLTTAQVDWVAINNASTITWAFPERAAPSDPLVREMIGKGVITAGDVERSGKPTIVWRDQVWTKAATYIIREHRPNLLLFHLLSLDSTHHNYGPRTLASYDAIAFLDSCVAKVLAAVKDAGIEGRTTVLVVSDHGFKAVTKQIALNSILHAAGLDRKAFGVSEGGSAMIYVKKDHMGENIAGVRRAFASTEGVLRIVDRSSYASLGLPDPEKDPQMADVVLYAKDEYAFIAGHSNDAAVAPSSHQTGSHGYLASDPQMNAIFVANGYGIKSGVVLDEIQNLSIAPTLAELLGVQFPKTKAKALSEILTMGR